MGTGDARGHANFGDIVAVCDVDSRHADRAKNDKNIGKGKADSYKDYRKVLDRDDIDVTTKGYSMINPMALIEFNLNSV